MPHHIGVNIHPCGSYSLWKCMHKFVYFQTLLQKEKKIGPGEVEEAGEQAEDDEEVYYDEEELEDVRMQNITSIDNQNRCFPKFSGL